MPSRERELEQGKIGASSAGYGLYRVRALPGYGLYLEPTQQDVARINNKKEPATTKTMEILEKLKPLALLWLRVALGVVFFFHGYQKLFGAPAIALQSFRHMGFPSYAVYLS